MCVIMRIAVILSPTTWNGVDFMLKMREVIAISDGKVTILGNDIAVFMRDICVGYMYLEVYVPTRTIVLNEACYLTYVSDILILLGYIDPENFAVRVTKSTRLDYSLKEDVKHV